MIARTPLYPPSLALESDQSGLYSTRTGSPVPLFERYPVGVSQRGRYGVGTAAQDKGRTYLKEIGGYMVGTW